MGSTSAASVKKLSSFQKCQRLISRYALALDRLQRNIFETFSENDEDMPFLNNGFCDLQKLETQHKPVCAKFAKCHQHCETPRIERLIESWQALVKTLETDQQSLIKDPESMRACHCLMKYIIGFCFLEAKYYEALLCSWELLRLTRFEDTTCWLLCLLWALRLGEWGLLGHLLAQEERSNRKWPLSTGYLLCVDCVRLVFRLGTATTNWDQRQASDELVLKMRELLANERKTFLFTQAKCILRSALVMASRVPNVNLEKLGDPLHQRELEMSQYMTVLRSYHPAFFDNSQSSSIQTKMDSADEFMRLCAAYADYMETAMSLCWDFWDAGQLNEAEAHCLLLWRNNLTFGGNPYWTLRPLSLLFHIRSNIVYEAELRKHLAYCLRALVTPPGTSTSYYLQTPKRLIRPSTFRRGSAVDDSFELETANGTETEAANTDHLASMLVDEMASVNILGSEQQKEQYPLDAHVPNCECTFCTGRASNWAMALELEWLNMLLQGYSPAQFQRFQQSLTILREQKIQPLRQQLFTRIFDNANFVVVNTPGPNDSQSINATPAAPKKRGRPPRKRTQPEKENHALKQQPQEQWPLVEVARLGQNAGMATPSLHLNRSGKDASDKEMSLTSNRPFDESLMPPQFIHLWARALNQMFLERPPTANSRERTLLNEAKQLCECTQLTHLADWLLLRHFERISQIDNNTGFSVTNQFHLALADFQNYGHLLFREWRGRCCQFLARFSDSTLCHQLPLRSSQHQTHAWQKAHFHVESMQPSMRQFAQTGLCRKLFRQKSVRPTTTVDNKEVEKAEPAGAQRPLIIEEEDSDEEKENFSANFAFRDSDRLKTCVERLPPDITFVNIALGDDGQLSLTRCHALHAPIVLNLCKVEQDHPMLARMHELLEASDQSVKVVRDIAARPQQPPPPQTPGRSDEPVQEQQERPLSESERKRAVTFWNERRRLDREMESFLAQLQSDWLSAAAPLLLPLNGRLSATSTKIANKYAEADIFSRATAITLIQLLDHLEEQPWLDLANLLLREEHRGRRERKEMAAITGSTWTKLREATRAGSNINGVKREAPRQYLLLAVPSTLSHLPWECLPIFKLSPLVMRIPSLHFFEHLAFNFQKIPKSVDGRNSFYVLNPDGDLALTQKRIAQFFDRFHWKGLVGEVPSREQIRLALTENDLFLYIGHGSGGRYFGRSTVRDSECKAVSILMGCSSVKIYNEGPGFDGRSILYEYLTARCPCVVGCLWMVTDGEIDKFFMALIEYCFAGLARNAVEQQQSANTPKGKSGKTASASKRQQRLSVAEETLKLLAEGMVHARGSCKLAHLTGAAVVAYGLPVVAAMVAEIADNQIG